MVETYGNKTHVKLSIDLKSNAIANAESVSVYSKDRIRKALSFPFACLGKGASLGISRTSTCKDIVGSRIRWCVKYWSMMNELRCRVSVEKLNISSVKMGSERILWSISLGRS